MNGHDTFINYMDDDTCEVGCHYCQWYEEGFEDEGLADRAIELHIEQSYDLDEEFDRDRW